MRRHPRERIVHAAERDLGEKMIEWQKAHDLTYIEELQILTREISSLLKFALRVERHGDDQTPAGLAKDE